MGDALRLSVSPPYWAACWLGTVREDVRTAIRPSRPALMLVPYRFTEPLADRFRAIGPSNPFTSPHPPTPPLIRGGFSRLAGWLMGPEDYLSPRRGDPRLRGPFCSFSFRTWFCLAQLKRTKESVVIQHRFVFLWTTLISTFTLEEVWGEWREKIWLKMKPLRSAVRRDVTPCPFRASCLPWCLGKTPEALMCCGKWQTSDVRDIGAWESVTCFSVIQAVLF